MTLIAHVPPSSRIQLHGFSYVVLGGPLGTITIPLNSTLITAAKLEYEMRHQLDEVEPRSPQVDTSALPRATVIIPTNFARPEQLRRCVERLTKLDYPDYEIIVADNRPEEATPVDIPGVRIVREPRPGASAARNCGVAAATGDIVAFTDDDVVADYRWLRAIGERFVREPDVSAVTGLVVPLGFETQAQILFEQSGNGPDRCFDPLTFEHVGRLKVLRSAYGVMTEQIRSIYLTGEFGLGSNMAFRIEKIRALGGIRRSARSRDPDARW